MRRVELHQTSDILQLENLKGDEYIFLKIYKSFHPSILSAINLKKYSGTIDISFEDKKSKHECTVWTESSLSRNFIFKNIEKANILLPRQENWKIKYKNVLTNFRISSGKHFEKVAKDLKEQEKVIWQIDDDIAMNDFPFGFFKNYHGKIILKGNQHTFYLKQTDLWQKFLQEHEVCVENLSIALADHIFHIQKGEDFGIIKDLLKGNSVISISKDLKDFTMNSLSLSTFYGNIVILGHNHSLKNVTIRATHPQISGFITSISPTSNLVISNLTLENISFQHSENCKHAGVFLGKRVEVPENMTAHFMPGFVRLINCHTKHAVIPKAKNMGALIGKSDDQMEWINCSATAIMNQQQDNITDYIGEDCNYYSSSFYPNYSAVKYDELIYNSYKKRERIYTKE